MLAARTLLRSTLAFAIVAPVAACSPGHDVGPQPPGASNVSPPRAVDGETHIWRDSTWHVSIEVPPGWTVHHDFKTSYLANDAWKTYAGSDSQGRPIVALVVPGSDRITDAEIRIGASKAAPEVQRCTAPPDAVRPGSLAHETIGGIDFTTFEAADAAMSHYLDVHGYRTVRGGVCYAIDLLVYGTNPQVFDPPAMPPFSRAQAFARMRAVVGSFHFTNGSRQGGSVPN
ncbi:MAG: hypothetical protein ACREPZ_03340 [Rhodanobacteraceae bacterium]